MKAVVENSASENSVSSASPSRGVTDVAGPLGTFWSATFLSATFCTSPASASVVVSSLPCRARGSKDVDEKRLSVWVAAGFEVGLPAAGRETSDPAENDPVPEGHEVSTAAFAVETFSTTANAGERSGTVASGRLAGTGLAAIVVPVAGGFACKVSSFGDVFGLLIGAPIPALTFAFDSTVVRLSIGNLLMES